MATKITNKDSYILSFFDSFDFDGTLEFDIHPNLIPTKNWEGLPPQPSRYHHYTSITRIRINLAKEKIFEYEKSQIINFAIEMPRQHDFESVLEEILSLNNVSKIIFTATYYVEGI